LYSVYLIRTYVEYRPRSYTYEIWLIDCCAIAAASLLARTRLIGLLSVHLSYARAGAVYTIASELSART
jgi:hypothetical protein